MQGRALCVCTGARRRENSRGNMLGSSHQRDEILHELSTEKLAITVDPLSSFAASVERHLIARHTTCMQADRPSECASVLCVCAVWLYAPLDFVS